MFAKIAWTVVALGLLLVWRVNAQAPAPTPTFAEALADQRREIAITERGISGPGAELLLQAASEAHYVLIGEEHGLQEVSQLARVLYDQAQPSFGILAVEIGSEAAKRVLQLARDPRGLTAFDEFQRSYPFAIPFACFREDAELMAHAAREGLLIGLDQEFLLATTWLLGEIEVALREVDPAAAEEAAALRQQEEEAWRQINAAGDTQAAKSLLDQDLPSYWAKWKALLAARPDVLDKLLAIEESQGIYALYHQQRYHDNNDQRAKVMKEHWRRACSSGCSDRALIRLGANHILRGMSPLGISDFGNFAAELAAAQGRKSLHVLVLPTGGAMNAWLPFLPTDMLALPIDPKGDGYAFFRPLLEAVPSSAGRAVYDLRPLRPRYRRFAANSPNLQSILLGYDLVVLIDKAQPAPLLPSLQSLAEKSATR